MNHLVTILILVLISACVQSNKSFESVSTSETGKTTYYKDYDVFERKGIDRISEDSLAAPYFEVVNLNDSTIKLTIIETSYKRSIEIPIDNRMFYIRKDIKDGSTDNYYKIENNQIIRFGYTGNIFEAENWKRDSVYVFELLPEQIEVTTKDTIYFMSSPYMCLGVNIMNDDDSEMIVSKEVIETYRVLPFSVDIDLNCELIDLYFCADSGKHRLIFASAEPGKYGSPDNPADGLSTNCSKHKYWRDYYFTN